MGIFDSIFGGKKEEIETNSTEILHILILNCDPGEERCTTILFVKTNVYI